MYSFVNKLKTGSHNCQPIITTCCGQIMIHKKNNLKDFFVKTIKNKRTKNMTIEPKIQEKKNNFNKEKTNRTKQQQ